MLSFTDNELLCRVGPGTPMGDLMRRYWVPGLLPSELPAPDGPPVRFRLLGEDLVAYRDTSSRVGVIAQSCPHRGASLFFGRNEEHGLRCVYHGWKFDVTGACVDMPNEPAESNFKHKIKATAYPAREQGAIIWVYMGPAELEPPLSGHLSNLLPADHVKAWKRHQASNYMQTLEGGIDPAHAAFLHSKLNAAMTGSQFTMNRLMAQAVVPHVHVLDEDYGVLIATRRDFDNTLDFWRTNIFQMPFYTMVGDFGNTPITRWSGWVPIDDENTMRFTTECDSVVPLVQNPQYQRRYGKGTTVGVLEEEGYEPPSNRVGSPFRTLAQAGNDYLIDRAAQKTQSYSGMIDGGTEDQAMTESMGPIYTRHQEHLGTTDLGIIAVRKALIRAAKALREAGATPRGVDTPDAYTITASNVLLSRAVDWAAGVRESTRIAPGAYHRMVSLAGTSS